eukprot:7295070-Karenia_brevis.AAC.1
MSKLCKAGSAWDGCTVAEIGTQLYEQVSSDPGLIGQYADLNEDQSNSKGKGEVWRDLLPMPLVVVPAEGTVAVRAKWCWLWLIVMVLNLAYNENGAQSPIHAQQANMAQCGAMEKLEEHVDYFLTIEGTEVPMAEWESYIASKDVDYCSNISGKAEYLTWDQMEVALPPKESAGKINALDLAHG